MAIYHFSAKPVQRSKGRSSVAAAAYRSRSTLRDERQGMTFSYIAATDLVHAEIVGFDGPRASLWNLAEAVEIRHDATTAREYEIALPNELSEADQIELAREFARWLNKNQSCAVDFAIHSGEGVNGHGHFLTTTRSVDGQGTMSDIKIQREWSDKKRKAHGLPGRKAELVAARKAWADIANDALKQAGFEERIDHRSLKDQGTDRLPTSHIGPAASTMERDGLQTRVGDHNRMIIGINLQRQYELDDLRNRESQVESLTQQLADIDLEIEAIRNEPAPAPTITGTIVQVESSPSIAAVADRESAKFSTGMAKTFGEQFKSKLFQDLWQTDIDPAILKNLRWVDVDDMALILKTGEQIVDRGDSVSLSKGSDDAIAAAIAMAKSKGWKLVQINGSEDFQLRAAQALQDAGIEPELNSENAKRLFSEKMQGRNKPAIQQLGPQPESVPEPKPELAPMKAESPQVDLRALEDRVLVAMQKDPIKAARYVKRDAKVLVDYASKIWAELDGDNSPAELGKIFQETLKQQAIVEGYSDEDLRSAQLMSHVSDLPGPGTDLNCTRPPDRSRRKWYSDAGYKPPTPNVTALSRW